MAGEHLFEFTDVNFKNEAIGSALPVIVDLWAPWCGPCKLLTPIIDEIARLYEGKVKIGKLNVDDSPQTASQYGIISIPTILFIKNGKVVDQHVGLLSKEHLKAKVEQFIK